MTIIEALKKLRDDLKLWVSNNIRAINENIEQVNTELAEKAEKEHTHSQYLTSIPEEYITETELETKGYLTSIPEEYITETELETKGYLTSIPEEYITETELETKGYLTSIPEEYITETELEAMPHLWIGDDSINTNVMIDADTLNGFTAAQIIAQAGGSGASGSGKVDYVTESKTGTVVTLVDSTSNNAALYPRTSMDAVSGLNNKITQLENAIGSSSGGGGSILNAMTFEISDTAPAGVIGKIWFAPHPTIAERKLIKIWNGVDWEVMNSWQ